MLAPLEMQRRLDIKFRKGAGQFEGWIADLHILANIKLQFCP